MIHRLASDITDFFVRKKIVKETEHEIYTYGFDLIISGLINILLVISTGIVIDKIWEALLFVCIMIIVRMYTGGYHADTHFMCNIIFLIVFLFSILAMKLVNSFEASWSIWILQCIGLIIVTGYAPLENRNKRLTMVQKEKYRIVSVILYLILIIISVVLNITDLKVTRTQKISFRDCGLYINIVLIIIAVLLVIGKRKEARHYGKENFKDAG